MKRSDQDETLGAALRELHVPDLRPSFRAELTQALRAEATVRRPSAAGRGRVRRWQLAAAVAVAVAALIAGTVWQLVGERGTPVASAAAIKARVSATFAKLETLQRSKSVLPGREGLSFGRRSASRLPGTICWRTSMGRSRRRTTPTGVERVIGQPGFYKVDLESTGLAPGGPDASPMSCGDPRVTEVEYRDRPAWQLEMELDPVPGGGGEKLYGDRVVTVDQATAFPVRIVEKLDGRTFKELHLENVVVNEEISRSAFQPAFTPGRPVIAFDRRFRRVGLGGVAKAVGYQPLVPSEMPNGFRLAEVAATERPETKVEIKRFGDRPGAARGARDDFLQQLARGSGAPEMRGVVSLSYRRGLDHVVVTTRRRTPGNWTNPFGGDYLFGSKPEVITLTRGAFAGSRAEIVIAPITPPQIWGMDDDLVFTVSGDASREELIAVAESLAR